MANHERGVRAREDRDPTAQLPTSILAHILTLLPLRTALRCGSLSKAWLAACRELLAWATKLDFGSDFAEGLPPERYAAAVDGALSLHEAETLRTLKVSFHPGSSFDLQFCVPACLEAASAKRVSALELDLQVAPESNRENLSGPSIVMAVNFFGRWLNWETLSILSLSSCRLTPLRRPLELPNLKSLSLERVGVQNIALVDTLCSCCQLSSLELTKCTGITEILIQSPPNLRLLTIFDCVSLTDVKIDALTLRTFHFWGNWCNINLICVTNLMDAYVSFTMRKQSDIDDILPDDLPGYSYSFFSALAGITTLTLCDASLELLIECSELWEEIPFKLYNLKELQLIVEKEEYHIFLWDFPQNCNSPAVESLLVELPADPSEGSLGFSLILSAVSLFFPFEKLRFMSIRGFEGLVCQLAMAQVFLKLAENLETLTLVVPDKRTVPLTKEEIAELHEDVNSFPKASPNARILICGVTDDPAHHLLLPHNEIRWKVSGYIADEELDL